MDEGNNGYDYYKFNFGDDEAKKIVLDNNLIDVNVVDDLIRKSRFIDFAGEYKFLFISKNGFTEKALARITEINGVHLDLKDIERLFEEI